MGYIGKPASTSFTETVKDSFNGDNSTTAFTMSQSVSLDTDIEVFVGNVQQEPGSGKAYTVSGTTLTFSEAPPTGTANIYVVHRNSLQGTILPPQNLGDRNYLIGGNLSLDKDSAVLSFGADSEITVTHVADTGLNIKHTATGDDKPVVLTLQTGETDIQQNDILGKIQFQAPDEGTGTDAILVAAGIQAVSEGDFSSSSNATALHFLTGASEAASSKMHLGSGGDLSLSTDGASIFFGASSEIELRHVADDGLILKHIGTGDGKEPSFTFQAGDTDIAQDDILGSIEFQAPDEGTGTDAVLVAAAIKAVSQGDFSSSSNATKLGFFTASSETATEKFTMDSNGDFGINTDGRNLFFGVNSEIKLQHVHNEGLIFKHLNTSDDSFPTLTFQTGDTDIAQDDVLGRILFQAPDEGTGTDAILASARIQAFSTGDFSSSSNSTGLEFRTATSAAVGTAGDGASLTLLPDHQLNLKALPTVDGSFPQFELQTGETTIETNDVLGSISFKAPDESSGTDAITQAAFIIARASADFTASVNSTKLQFGVGSSGSATTRMSIEPDGDVSIEAGNLVLASGQGIDFSAFSNDSEMTSELLDDYEEGLVTVGTNVGAGSLSFGSNDHLAYPKIGRVVYISGAIQMASESGTSGNYVQFTNLPYAADDLDGMAGRVAFYISHDGATVTDGDDLVGFINESGQLINLYRQNENGHNLGGGQIDSNSVLYFSFFYQAAS